MVLPDARIYSLSDAGIETVAYEDTEHYRVTRNFLNRHKKIIRDLTAE